jgi:hypothetical protein
MKAAGAYETNVKKGKLPKNKGGESNPGTSKSFARGLPALQIANLTDIQATDM